MTAQDEPRSTDDLRALLLDYLDHYRDQVVTKVSGMSEEAVRTSILPSGWTPAQLLNHLAFMEQRWFVCTFEGREVPDGRGDWDGDRWATPTVSLAHLVEALHAAGVVTRGIVEGHALDERAANGGSYAVDTVPHLHWILLHVLQEYARHAGQLDIVAELSDVTRPPAGGTSQSSPPQPTS